jgi:hypothetical protein
MPDTRAARMNKYNSIYTYAANLVGRNDIKDIKHITTKINM